MQIILAQSMGMCFGVRDALSHTQQITEPQNVTILGELVHNPTIHQRLSARGFAHISESDRDILPASPSIMITAHGISNRTRAALTQAGKTLVDTTCPLVKKAHAAALRLAAEGQFVIVIGKPTHVEVLGLTGDLSAFAVVQQVAHVRRYAAKRIGIICQTTTSENEAAAIRCAVIQQNPQAQITFVDTICQPTKDRQIAMEQLLDVVQAVVVVGGGQSNNTRKLVERSVERGVPAFHIESPEELQARWFVGCQRVGLTAGTSTLPETIAAVQARLACIATGHLRRAV